MILVLGDHPAAYLASLLLRDNPAIPVLHAALAQSTSLDRQVLINPEFFSLHPRLGALRRSLDSTAIFGLKFIADDPVTSSEYRSKSTQAMVVSYRHLRDALAQIAKQSGSILQRPRQIHIQHLDETGITAMLDDKPVHATALILAGTLSPDQLRQIGLDDSWDHEVMHRYCTAKLPKNCKPNLGQRPIVPMSLDLKRSLCWAWLLPHESSAQLCTMQAVNQTPLHEPAELLRHWLSVLCAHGLVAGNFSDWKGEPAEVVDLPLAGALAREGVANRTLLVGPGGGFYSACGEDIYPNCWSSIFAVQTIRSALNEKHFQDALQPYRHGWRTTLGEYLRGPQQNLRFLLPLIYRNQKMTDRLAEAILQGKHTLH